MSGPREEDGDYAREFFDGYEREADRLTGAQVIDSGCHQRCRSWFGLPCDCGGERG